MTIKVIAQIENDVMERLIELYEDFETMSAYEEAFDDVLKAWRKQCKGSTNFTQMFEALEDTFEEAGLAFRWIDDNIEEIIKAKA